MLNEIAELYSPSVLEAALQRFGFGTDSTHELGGWESFVYECHRDSRAYILKITHTIRRTREHILGELDFIAYLVSGGVPASAPINSSSGNLVEAIEADQGSFLAYAFTKAPGAPMARELWTPELLGKWGELIGSMHALSKDYTPSDESFRRWSWDTDLHSDFKKYLPRADLIVRDKARELYDRLHSLPMDHDSFGLIHVDLHAGNLFRHGDTLFPFDFDDCLYSWFVCDIAMALYYVLHEERDSWGGSQRDVWPGSSQMTRGAIIDHFIKYFMEGYRSKNALDDWWLSKIPDMLRLRLLDLYIEVRMAWEGEGMTPERDAQLERHRRSIEDDVWIDVGFERFG